MSLLDLCRHNSARYVMTYNILAMIYSVCSCEGHWLAFVSVLIGCAAKTIHWSLANRLCIAGRHFVMYKGRAT